MQKQSEPERLDRVRRLVALYEKRVITGTSLINDVAECVTPENVDRVVEMFPQDMRPRLVKWIDELPDPASEEMVIWPLPNGVTLALKQWLKRQEAEAATKSDE